MEATEVFETFAKALFDEVADAGKLDTFEDVATRRITPGGYGDNVVHARGFFMAHLAAVVLSDDADRGGELASKTVGDISKSWQVSDDDEFLSLSKYGRFVADLREQNRDGFGPIISDL